MVYASVPEMGLLDPIRVRADILAVFSSPLNFLERKSLLSANSQVILYSGQGSLVRSLVTGCLLFHLRSFMWDTNIA